MARAVAGFIDPQYPKVSEQGGRPPIALERMLAVYFLRLLRVSEPDRTRGERGSACLRLSGQCALLQALIWGANGGMEATVCKFPDICSTAQARRALAQRESTRI